MHTIIDVKNRRRQNDWTLESVPTVGGAAFPYIKLRTARSFTLVVPTAIGLGPQNFSGSPPFWLGTGNPSVAPAQLPSRLASAGRTSIADISRQGKGGQIYGIQARRIFSGCCESAVLWNQAMRPDESVMARRDRFFADIDTSIHITHTPDGGMIIETT